MRPHAVLGALLRGAPLDARELAPGHEPQFAAWCEQHRLGPFVHRLVDPDSRLAHTLREQYLVAQADDLSRQSWVRPLLARCASSNVEVCTFKGCGIAHMTRVYSAAFERPLGDLDLLIAPTDIDAFVGIAAELGFDYETQDPEVRRFQHQTHYQVALWHEQHGLLEAHHRLYDDVMAEQEVRFRARAERVEVYGEAASILCPADMYLVLAAHLFRNPTVLWIWLLDLYLLARSLTRSDWDLLLDEARRGGQSVFVDAALACCEHLWGPCSPHLDPAARRVLTARLSNVEQAARRRLVSDLETDSFRGYDIMLARRLSGRPYRRPGRLFDDLVPTAGLASIITGHSSSSRSFWQQRGRAAFMQLSHATRRVFTAAMLALEGRRSDPG